MKLIGLGGGIGAGKSTVSAQLATHGAAIVDADLVARQVVEPDTPALEAIAQRFGAQVIGDDGRLKRPALAAIVFHDADALSALNAITHPAIAVEMRRQIAEHLHSERVVVWDAALLFDSKNTEMVGRMVVDVNPEIAVARLQEFRGFSETDARARVASQMPRSVRLSHADFVLDNSSTPQHLAEQVERAWAWIATLPQTVHSR